MKGVKLRRNKQYTKEFRDSTVQLALNSEEPIRKIAEDLDIKYHTLYDWIKAHRRAKKKSDKAHEKESIEEELKRLRRENLILKEERDILKKATAYFAKETL
jgi:transposase